MCKAIDNPALGNDTFSKLYGAATVYYNYTGDAKCFDLADDSDPHGLAEWSWQVTQFSHLIMFLNCSRDHKEFILVTVLRCGDGSNCIQIMRLKFFIFLSNIEILANLHILYMIKVERHKPSKPIRGHSFYGKIKYYTNFLYIHLWDLHKVKQ